MEPILAGMKRIKREGECCCCFGKEDLFSMLEPYNFEEKVEIYSTMIAECFQIELSSCIEDCNKYLYLICKNCILRLRDANTLRSQVKIAYARLQAESCKTDDQADAISNECTDIVETKENIVKCEVSEYDNKETNVSVEPEASLANENVLKLQPLHVGLKKNDNKRKNKTIVSTKINLNKIKMTKKISKNTNDNHDAKSQLSNEYTCDICNRSYKNLRSKQQHMLIHWDRSFCCDHCGKSFKKRYSLANHIKIHYKTRENICDICGKSYKRKDHLMMHKKTHTDGIKNEIFLCNFCGKSCRTKSLLITHRKTHEDRFFCDICKRFFKRKQVLRDHIMSHMGMFDVKCDICKNDFVSKIALGKHVKMHHVQSESCPYCNKSFGNKRYLNLHIKRHMERKTYNCKICGKIYSTKGAFNDHLLTHSGVKSQKCEICNEAFVTWNLLLDHRKIHLNPDRVTCKYCNKVFRSNYILKQHEKIHLDIKDLICDICNKGYRQKTALKEHILLHMDIKNIKCDLCDERFVSKSSLGYHKRLYHSLGFPCKVCGFTCKSKTYLNIHSRIHTKDGIFICDYCGRGYKTKFNVQQHIWNNCKVVKGAGSRGKINFVT